jgi:uncharacterized FAD-dependent dehydrogenase
MKSTINIVIPASQGKEIENVKKECSRSLSIAVERIAHVQIIKRSIDARSRIIKLNLTCDVYFDVADSFNFEQEKINRKYHVASHKATVHIVGAGPAGLFAALKLLEHGIKPIIFERGKNVQERRRDLAAINKEHLVNPNSNYCFGEGGAGTYSDGKLYTRSTKRGDVEEVLKTLVYHGADENILVEAHPHIGTNKLPKVIEQIRHSILQAGGEIHFNTKLVDLHKTDHKITSVITENLIDQQKTEHPISEIIFATGHSARDIYTLLQNKNIKLEAKPFALGVRVEHPQLLIDEIQYHCSNEKERNEKREYLPAAPYSWVQQINGRGVYSFCMCPGGIIAPCATSQNEIVTNGWSPSKRNNPYSNSGIVVSINEEDYKPFAEHKALAGMHFQAAVEHEAWIAGGKTQVAPAQRLIDFVQNKTTSELPVCSYLPGVVSSNIHEVLPKFVAKALQDAFIMQGKKMHGYMSSEAIIVATESRTSTPVRIPRHATLLHHVEMMNMFPCAEGAGYAGGIVSAAIDGERIANLLAEKII